VGDARDTFANFPPIPTASAPTVVVWDSGPDPTGMVGVHGLRPPEEVATTHRIAFALKTDQAWTMALQQMLSDANWVTVNAAGAGLAVDANAVLDANVHVAGAGRRRVAAIFATKPTAWITSGAIRLIADAASGA
jgi:hypothetical protein